MEPLRRSKTGALVLAILLCSGCVRQGGACDAIVYIPPRVQLIYPMPDSTSVPDNTGLLIFRAYVPYPPVALTAGSTSVPTTPIAVPSPLPSPAATPWPSSPGLAQQAYFAVSFGTLAAATTYTAEAGFTYTPGCYPTRPVQHIFEPFGSFTTQ